MTNNIGSGSMLSDVMCDMARRDSALFCQLVLRDEETGRPVRLHAMQKGWHDHLDDHRRLVLWAHPDSGKTQNLAVGRIAWLLGRDMRRRYAVLSATHDGAVKVVRTVKSYIENSSVLHKVFPDLRRGALWTDTAIQVDRPPGIKDPSLQAYSPEVGSIQGSRLDGLVIDDILTQANTRTPHQRRKLIEWVRASAFSRLSRGAWVVVLANAWHPEDMAHELAKSGWPSLRCPVLDDAGEPTWRERWPLDRVQQARETLGPLEFARQMMCAPRADEDARFRAEWIDVCLERGRGYSYYDSLADMIAGDADMAAEFAASDAVAMLGGGLSLPEGFATVTGVDLAVSKKKASGLTSLFSVLLWPDGTRHLVDLQAGRWGGPEIIDRILSVHERWGSIVVVESNAAQDYIRQWAKDRSPDIRIAAFNTNARNKHDPSYGVESIANELEAGRWLIPCGWETMQPNAQVGEWIGEMLSYDPLQHTGDRLMASWICREYCRHIMRARARAAAASGRGMRVFG